MSEYALELAGIEKVYKRGTPGEVAVLRGATLEVKRGEVVALVAPSGAGKSTLLHIAGLLDTPDAGSVALSGRNMVGLSDRERTLARRGEVGFIYQFHHLLPEFTALENIVGLKKVDVAQQLAAIADIDAVLGLNLMTLTRQDMRVRPKAARITEAEIETAITARKEARAAKDFAKSDAIRDDLIAKGVEVMDGDPLGWDWKLDI
jgi:ABC-type polar amino acid transport system ATPase subunit